MLGQKVSTEEQKGNNRTSYNDSSYLRTGNSKRKHSYVTPNNSRTFNLFSVKKYNYVEWNLDQEFKAFFSARDESKGFVKMYSGLITRYAKLCQQSDSFQLDVTHVQLATRI